MAGNAAAARGCAPPRAGPVRTTAGTPPGPRCRAQPPRLARDRSPHLEILPGRSGTISPMDADVIVVGGGLSGLVATAELASADHSVLLVEGESIDSLGGQAFWSLGGLFGVNTSEQRR